MRNPVKYFVLFLLSLLFLSACGQKGPLFLPGDPSTIKTTVPQQQPPVDESEEDDEDETPITIQN